MRSLRVLNERAEAIRARVRGEIAGLVDREPGDAGLVAAALHAHAALDAEGARVLARSPSSTPACAAGCSFCCHVHVDATAPEILAIERHLRRASAEEAIRALRERLAAAVQRVEGMTDEARWEAKIPCALLGEDGRCSIYAVRPLRCRAFHSCAVEPCREAFAGNTDAEPVPARALERAHDAVEEGYDQALVERGLTAEGYRLEVGLWIALEEPVAGERWRAGEAVFARARARRQ